ncbi:MAG: TIR domain-containing protein [Candidatus Hermodarchaeota archaeon]
MSDSNSKLNQIEQLIDKGEFKEILNMLQVLEDEGTLNATERVQSQIFNSTIFTILRDSENGLKLAEQALTESERLENPLLAVDAIIAKATALIDLGELNRCPELFQDAEARLLKLTTIPEFEKGKRNATLDHLKGRFFLKKDEFKLALDHLNRSLTIRKKYAFFYGYVDTLKVIGIVYAHIGDHKSALKYSFEGLAKAEELQNKSLMGGLCNNIGLLYNYENELDKAQEYYQKALDLREWLDDYTIAVLSLNMGKIHLHEGVLTKSYDSLKEALDLFKKIGRRSERAVCLTLMGHVHMGRGELDNAMHYYETSLKLLETLEKETGRKDILQKAYNYNNLGDAHCAIEEFREALNSYTKSLNLIKKTGNTLELSLPLFNLISVFTFMGLAKKAESYLQQLKKLDKTEENKTISQRCRIAEALVLKSNGLASKRAEAKNILINVLKKEDEAIDPELAVIALFNLCDLLLNDLRMFGQQKVLKELQTQVDRLVKINQKRCSYWSLATTYLFQSKLKLLELDIQAAQTILELAYQTAEKHGLQRLLTLMSSERDLFQKTLPNWKQYELREAPMIERLKLSMVEGLVMRMSEGGLYAASFPVEACDRSRPYIFVSYSHKEKSVVYPDIFRLNQSKYRIWYDEGITPMSGYHRVITRAIDKCSLFLIFISPYVNESKYIKKEIRRAIDKNKLILPIYINETKLDSDLQPLIEHIQGIQITDPQYYRKLTGALPSFLKQSTSRYRSFLPRIRFFWRRRVLNKDSLI